jgi:flagellar motor switch/type III secretory pathway protein FliN
VQALVSVPQPHPQEEKERFGGVLGRLPVELDVVVPVKEFRVRNLLMLEPGNVIPSQWSYGDDVPLAAGAAQLAWTEFEVIDTHLAVRITRLP